jgi:hypothetical protein
MDFFSNDGRRLETLADWRDQGRPVSSRRWAEGQSARELARAWIERDAAAEVTALLTSVPDLAGLVLDRGIPESETRFPGGSRLHDLLVIGRAPIGTILIGVEGKSDEPFEEPLDARAMREPTARLDDLTSALFGATLTEDPLLAPLRFQLLSALAGTLAEARRQDAVGAVLLVHEFETPWTRGEQQRRNAEDLDAFLGRLMPGVQLMGEERAWVAGPLVLAGDGSWLPEEAAVYVAKLVSRTR